MDRIIRIAAGLLIGWVASEITEDALREIGVPKKAATIAGGIAGAIL
jgi:uncharacterized membrane protein YeaQ/YmgE (transglycosylase-associated protein family)